MAHPDTEPRWQRRAEARPQELLEAALQEFVTRGYAATRLEEVARRAGVSKGTLYLYYANKEELFKAVVRHALVSNLDEAERLASDFPGSSRELLTRLLGELSRRIGNSQLSGIPKLVIAEAGNFPEIACFYYDEVIRRVRGIVQAVLERGAAAGEFRRLDADHAWRVVIAPLLLGMLWKHSFLACEPETFDPERHLASHLDLLFDGLVLSEDSK
ncbi:MAG: TetR/AcrR family transcriptional regulator [Pseudomonadota bacterium]